MSIIPINITPKLADAIDAIKIGFTSPPEIGKYLRITPQTAYARLKKLVGLGAVKKNGFSKYSLLDVELNVLEFIPKNPMVSTNTEKVLLAIIAGHGTNKKLRAETGRTRSQLSNDLVSLLKFGLIDKNPHPNGNAQKWGFTYKYTGKSYETGKRSIFRKCASFEKQMIDKQEVNKSDRAFDLAMALPALGAKNHGVPLWRLAA